MTKFKNNFSLKPIYFFKKIKYMTTINKKILIATGIYPPDIGGPATIVKALSDSLIENGFEVKIITYSTVKYLNSDDENVFRILKNGLVSKIKYLFKMYQLALWSDVVYVTDTYSVGYFAYILKKIINKKYIIRFAGDSAWEASVANGWTSDYILDFQDNKYDNKIENLKKRRAKILINANKVIAVSNFMSLVAQKIGVLSKNIRVIYNSIDFVKDNDNDEISEKLNQWKKEFKIITTVCRLTPWKGVDGVIRILPGLNNRFGKVMLLVIGDGPEKNNLIKLSSENNMSENVKFLGKVDHDNIIQYLSGSDVFVLNTNYEGLSHTLLESMRAGAPIVTTNVGGNPEVIGNGVEGLLVDYNNDSQLLEAVSKILSNGDLSMTLANNAKKKLSVFNWENTISKTIDLIKEI